MPVKEVPADTKEMTELRDAQIKDAVSKEESEPLSIKDILRKEVEEWQIVHQTKKQEKENKLPRLTTLAGTKILEKHFKFCTFSTNEMERLAMYLSDEGIYTQNYRYIKRTIEAMYPPFNESQAEEVIYHLINRAKVNEQTVSRYLIPVKNGIFNLKQHRLIEFNPNYVFTTKIKTKYIENSIPPNINGWTFDSWLKEIACGDREIIELMWEVIADCLNGNFTRKKAIFLYSEHGSSGKGTFQRLIQNLVGTENVGVLKVNQFDERFRLSNLAGKTVCIGDDISPDIYIKDSSNFNSVVTGDPVMIEFKGRDSYTSTLRCTVVQSCNGLPNFKNKCGTRRRMLIVPFNNQFEGKNDNWNIKDDYLNRADVLEYVLYQALQKDFESFTIPKSSKEALKEFELDNNPMLGFKTSFFDQYNIERIPTYYLYGFYKRYCKTNNFKPLGLAKFTRSFMSIASNYEKHAAKLSSKNILQLKEIKENDELTNYEALPERQKVYNSIIRKQVSKKL